MDEPQAVRWNIRVSKETDTILRTFLGDEAMKKDGLSRFIEEAVRWRVFSKTVRRIKANNAGAGLDELQSLVDHAVAEVRAERRPKEPARRS